MRLVYLSISAQGGCVMNDSVLTRVEGYSRTGGEERGIDGERERERDKRVKE